MVALVLVFLFALDFLFAANGQHIVLERNLDVLALEPRHFGRNHDFLIGFGHVDAGNEIGLGLPRHIQATREVLEQTIDFPMQETERIGGWVDTVPAVSGGNK